MHGLILAATTGDVTKAGKAIGLALGVGLGALGAGVGIGNIFGSLIQAGEYLPKPDARIAIPNEERGLRVSQYLLKAGTMLQNSRLARRGMMPSHATRRT